MFLKQIKSGNKAKSFFVANKSIVTPLFADTPNIKTYSLNYDSETGTLKAIKPDGSTLETTGFNTLHTIGTGEQGAQGSLGSDGIFGGIGLKGIQGRVGNRGATGTTGYTGPIGKRGPVGDVGDIGNTGVTGKRGPRGEDGNIGDTGPVGYTGYHGEDYVLSTVFSESAPENVMKPNGFWFQIKTNTSLANARARCGGNTVPDITKSFGGGLSTGFEPCWRIVLFDVYAVDKSKDGLIYDTGNTARNTLIDLFAERALTEATFPLSIPCVDRSDSLIQFPSLPSSYVWKNTNVPWHPMEPFVASVIRRPDGTLLGNGPFNFLKTSVVQVFDYVRSNYYADSPYQDSKVFILYYDRIGNNPGIRI